MSKIPIRDIIIGVNVAEHLRKNEDYKEKDSNNHFDENKHEKQNDFYSTVNNHSRYTDSFEGKETIDIQDYFREEKKNKRKKERLEVIVFFLKCFLLLCILLWIAYSK